MDVISDPAEVHRLASRAYLFGATHLAPIFNAVIAGRVKLACATSRTMQFPRRAVKSSGLPALVLVGDDDDAATGPAGWRCATEAARWAKAAIVHGAGADVAFSQAAVEGAIAVGRFLLVETSSQFVRPWSALLAGKPVLAVIPRGGLHPLVPGKESLH